jgi:hypothetical protein
MKNVRILTACLGLFAGLSATLPATPINMPTVAPPDVFAFGMGFSYDATTKVLYGSGWAGSFVDNTNSLHFFDFTPPAPTPTLTINALINNDGSLVSGTLSVVGSLPTLGGGVSGTLITGTLIAFGFNDPPAASGDPLQFLFQLNGPGLLNYMYPSGRAGFTAAGTGPSNNYAANWDNVGVGSSAFGDLQDAPIPEPSSLLLMGSGLGAALLWRRRRNR